MRWLNSLVAVRTLALFASVLALGAAAAPAEARRSVPRSFVGMNVEGVFLEGRVDMSGQMRSMVAAGVESLRVVVDWRSAQPYRTFDEVPPERRSSFREEGGVPTDWSIPDDFVRRAAQRHMTVLPVPMIAPDWSAERPGQFVSPPRDPEDYARFMAAMVGRYGPEGRFWAENPGLPRVPIRHWQLWNEPSFDEFWDKPWEREYVALVRSARTAIKAADPGAQIVLAGFPNESWETIEAFYANGGEGLLDAVAIHPFTRTIRGVVTIAERVREVMRRHGDGRKPLLLTELSWTSARGKVNRTFGFDTTERGQAEKVRAAFSTLADERRRLRIARAYWFTWMTEDRLPDYPFDYSGIVTLRSDNTVRRKPAYGALRRTALGLEGCRRKSGDASRCAR
jgi:hypothetical protein